MRKQMPIQAACWLKLRDESDWYLYLASDQITDENSDKVYEEVVNVERALDDPWFDPFQVKVLSADDPLAKAALEMSSLHTGRVPPQLLNQQFRRLGVEDAIFYPAPVAA